MKKTYPVIIKKDEHGVFFGFVPTLKSCHTQGDSPEEVLRLLKTETIPLCEEMKTEMDFPQEELVSIEKLMIDYA